jgi:hypothetical protein
MKTPPIQRMDLPKKEVEAILQRVKAALSEADYEKLRALVDSFAYLTHMLEDKRTTIDRLRRLLFGSSTEKTRDVIETKGGTSASPPAAPGHRGGTPTLLRSPSSPHPRGARPPWRRRLRRRREGPVSHPTLHR